MYTANSLKVSVLGVAAVCKIFYQSHSLDRIPGVEVSLASSIKSHLTPQGDTSEESAQQLHFIESVVWTVSLEELEPDPRIIKRLSSLLRECRNFAPQVFSACLIKEVSQESILDVGP